MAARQARPGPDAVTTIARLPRPLHDQLRAIAHERGISIALAIVQAVEAWVRPPDGQTIAAKLNLTADQLNALYVSPPVGGEVGSRVAADLATRYGLDPLEPLGAQLAGLGILTEAEGRWLDDQD